MLLSRGHLLYFITVTIFYKTFKNTVYYYDYCYCGRAGVADRLKARDDVGQSVENRTCRTDVVEARGSELVTTESRVRP